MPVPLEQFVKRLEDSGIIAGDTLQDFIPPRASPKDAEELARELVRQKKLTKFQAEAVYKGNGKSLILDNYVLLEKIGEGGMGQVFKAEHRRMHRIVAVKVLPTGMMKNAATVARFQREVQAAARINHPNIVTAFDAGQDGGVHFLVMEYVEASDLAAIVKKNGPFPTEQAVNLILQAARGLEAAHAQGIVHRDIKPANVLVDKEGTVKILDMGLARLSTDESGQQADLTSTGTIMGTVDYMSPEQALDTKSVDERADIYSLGCSLFYLLTGKPMYQGDTLMKKLLAHRELPIPSLRADRPEVAEQVEVIFSRMVAKNVEDRYQAMTDVISDLQRCLTGKAASFDTRQLFGSSTDAGLTNFLRDISFSEAEPALRKTSAGPSSGKDIKSILLIGGGVLGVLILLAGVVFSLRSQDGMLVVTVNEPDAEVQVLNEAGEVEITRNAEKGLVTIAVVPGKHRLKVTKAGFDLFAEGFEMKSGGRQSISARLIPVVAEKSPTPADGWIGLPEHWAISSTAITGSGLSRLDAPTYLCSRKRYRDFSMDFEVWLKRGNSGVQIRSESLSQLGLTLMGPQVDIGPGFWGDLFGQNTSGMMRQAPSDFERTAVRATGFNHVSIRCVGKHITIEINGQKSVDDDFPEISADGLIGLQLFTPDTEVEFRNIRLTEINKGRPGPKPNGNP